MRPHRQRNRALPARVRLTSQSEWRCIPKVLRRRVRAVDRRSVVVVGMGAVMGSTIEISYLPSAFTSRIRASARPLREGGTPVGAAQTPGSWLAGRGWGHRRHQSRSGGHAGECGLLRATSIKSRGAISVSAGQARGDRRMRHPPMFDAAIGPCRTSEIELARELVGDSPQVYWFLPTAGSTASRCGPPLPQPGRTCSGASNRL